VLAAANQELLRNDVAVNLLGYGTIFLVLVLTYRRFCPAAHAPAAPGRELAVNRVHGLARHRLSLETLPVIAVGIGFGVDFRLYLVSRTSENYLSLAARYAPGQDAERVRASVLEAMTTSAKRSRSARHHGRGRAVLDGIAHPLRRGDGTFARNLDDDQLGRDAHAAAGPARLLRPQFIQRRIPLTPDARLHGRRELRRARAQVMLAAGDQR
jgi:hypothetical protein